MIQIGEKAFTEVEARNRLDELNQKVELLGDYRKLSHPEKTERRLLREAFFPRSEIKEPTDTASTQPEKIVQMNPNDVAFMEAKIVTPAEVQSEDLTLENERKLIACFGEIRDTDDKGRLGQLVNDKNLLSRTSDEVFSAAFGTCKDGSSRAILRRYFGKQ